MHGDAQPRRRIAGVRRARRCAKSTASVLVVDGSAVALVARKRRLGQESRRADLGQHLGDQVLAAPAEGAQDELTRRRRSTQIGPRQAQRDFEIADAIVTP